MLRARKTVSRAPANDLHQLIGEAQGGTADRLGELLERYRSYLQRLARSQIDSKLRSKISESDLVQETMLSAYRDVTKFRGHTERQFAAWLRQILLHRLHYYVQRYVVAGKRDVRRECSLDEFDDSQPRTNGLGREPRTLVDPSLSPAAILIRQEDSCLLAQHLARLPEDYRAVVILRSFHSLGFSEVAAKLGRSEGATRMLWVRAVSKLRKQMAC